MDGPPIVTADELKQLRWRCRRGMKELDLLLTRYLEERFATATAAEQRAFRELLSVQDPLIHAWCLGRLAVPPELRALIETLVSPPRRDPPSDCEPERSRASG